MPGTDNIANTQWHPNPRAMRAASSSRRRPIVPPRRTSSAPDLRVFPSLGSMTSPSNEPSSPSSSAFSCSSDLPRSAPHDSRDFSAPIASVAPAHHEERIRPVRSATEPSATLEPPRQELPSSESAPRPIEELHRAIRELQRRRRRGGATGLWIAIRAFFGYGPDGSAARRDIVSLTGKMLFGAGQIGTTIGVLCIATAERSPTNHALTQWQECRRPLGEWCSIWCVRVVFGCIMAVWEYRRKVSRSVGRAARADGDAANQTSHTSADSHTTQPATSQRRSSRRRSESRSRQRVSPVTFARLSTLLSLASLTWFVTAHVLIYTSVHTCRFSAPHLWWLTFGIICIGYLVIVEVILVAFIIFILSPLIFVFLNLILICMGRQPLHHMNHINPEVGKLPQKTVDLIPLVLYIPAPVPKGSQTTGDTPQDSVTPHVEQNEAAPASPLTVPDRAHVHSYPPAKERSTIMSSPASQSSAPQRPRRLFTFRRIRPRMSPKGEAEKGKSKQPGGGVKERVYEDKWERGEYPFVKLEGNRAACAICLCDFEAPRRVRYSVGSRPAEDLDGAEKGKSASPEPEPQDGGLRLKDAGEGAQPLRLLACAHVFHKSCLDPWLTEVSGRCPVCQRPVDIDDPTKS